jgi:hypothetical protein
MLASAGRGIGRKAPDVRCYMHGLRSESESAGQFGHMWVYMRTIEDVVLDLARVDTEPFRDGADALRAECA